MKKKVLSFLLAITMISACITIPTSAEEGENDASVYEPSSSESLLMNLGIVDRENYNGNDIMTRGEFAVLLAKTLGLDIERNNETSVGIPDVKDSEIINPTSAIFKDVGISSDEYGAIVAIYEKGYMVGVSEGLFAPEYGIVLSDATKVFIDMLGFYEFAKIQGGYREGYEKVASSLSLLNGVSCGFSDVATKKDIASLLCNVMGTRVAQIENEKLGYIISDDETFMEKVMDINKITGIITDNGLTALDGASDLLSNQILCDNVVINISAEDTYVRKYLGRKVNVYYTDNKEDEYDLIFAEPKDEVIVISKKNYVDFNDGILEYYSEKDTLKTIYIGRYESVIYNEVYTSTYTDDIFDIADGQITLIPKGNKYTVIIEDYKNFVVSKTKEETSSIYNKITFDNEQDGINNLILDDYQEVCILNEDKKPIPFSSIKEDDVLSVLLSPDYQYAEVILSTDKIYDVSFKSVSTGKYVTDTEVYDYLDVFKKASNYKPVKYGKIYTLYFNIFGTLVWVEESTESEDGFIEGILLKFFPDEETEDKFGIKVYESNGAIKTYYIDGKLRLNSSTIKAKYAYSKDGQDETGIFYHLDVLGKPILYKAKDQIIKEIVTPLGYETDDDQRGWYQITADDVKLKHIADDGASFGGVLSYNSESNIYFVPNDNDKITVNETSFRNFREYAIEGYAKSKNAIFADVLVYREDPYKIAESKNAFLIADVYETLDDKEEIRTIFEGYEFNITGVLTKKSYLVAEETIKTYNYLGAGDIIRFSKNYEGEIKDIEVSYDYYKNTDGKITGTIQNEGCEGAAYTYMGYMMNINDEGFRIKSGSTIRTYISGDGYPVVIVDTSGNKLTFEEASMDEVLSYEDTSSGYDTVVVMTHYYVGRMGTVVYR